MKKVKIILLTVFSLSVLFPSATFAEDDFQYWSRYALKVIDTKYFDYTNYWEFRVFEDASDIGLWYTSQKFSVDAHPYLSLGLNYTYLENEGVNKISKDDEFKYQHRLELEVNPHWQYKDWIKLKNRNRMEFRWIEDQGSDNGRYRQMWAVEVPIKNVPVLKSIYVNNELFFDLNKEKYNQNRLIPFGVTLSLPGKSSLQIFYMIQSVKKKDWSSNQILGSQINISF